MRVAIVCSTGNSCHAAFRLYHRVCTFSSVEIAGLLYDRRRRQELRRGTYAESGIQWHGTHVGQPDFSENSRLVAYSIGDLLFCNILQHRLSIAIQQEQRD